MTVPPASPCMVQVRIAAAACLYGCNSLVFVALLANACMEGQSRHQLMWNVLYFSPVGTVLPVALSFLIEAQTRRTHILKSSHLSAHQIGRFWSQCLHLP